MAVKQTIKKNQKQIKSTPMPPDKVVGKKLLLVFVIILVVILIGTIGAGVYYHFKGKIQIPIYVFGIFSSTICLSIFSSFYIILRHYFPNTSLYRH